MSHSDALLSKGDSYAKKYNYLINYGAYAFGMFA